MIARVLRALRCLLVPFVLCLSGGPPLAQTAGQEPLGRLPIHFVPNVGQWPDAVRFGARLNGLRLAFHDDGYSLSLAGEPGRLRCRFMARAGVSPEAAGPVGRAARGRLHWLHGADERGWRRDVLRGLLSQLRDGDAALGTGGAP